jgi:hypothetical protein
MLRQAIFGETKAQGSGEIAAPVALYAGEFWRTPIKKCIGASASAERGQAAP